MITAVQIAISLALLGAVTWLFNLWAGLFDNFWFGAGLWIAACLAYAFIYDRRQASKRRSNSETTERGQ